MRVTVSAAAFLILFGCGGRTLLDDPDDELPLDGGHHASSGSSSTSGSSGSSSGETSDAGECGGESCSSSEECCIDTSGLSMTSSGAALASAAKCVSKGTCTGITATCGSKSDCSGGDICCGALQGGVASLLSGGTPMVSISCDKTCASGSFQLCASDSECPKGVTCQSTMFMVSLCGGLGAVLGGLGDAGFGGFAALGH